MILIVDNYDSFTFNLVQCIGSIGGAPLVVRNDAAELRDIDSLRPDAIVVSPGPGRPQDAGLSIDVIRDWYGRVPMLGVCLGHQCLAAAFGGTVERATFPLHGRSSHISHDSTGLFAGLPSPFDAGRYHSLAVARTGLPDRFRISALAEDGTVMAIEDRSSNAFGVQFHPESFLTSNGVQILSNFISMI